MKKRSFSYRTRLTVICLLLVTIPMGIFGIVSISRSYSQMEQSIQMQSDQSVKYLDHALSTYFANINGLTVLPLYDTSVIETLVKHSSGSGEMMTFEDNHLLTSFLNGVNYDRETVSQVSLYVPNGTLFYSNGFMASWRAENEVWMSYCDTNPYRAFMLVDEKDVYACRALEQPLFGRPMGYIRVRINYNALKELVEKIYLPEGSNIYIYNAFGQFIYPVNEADTSILAMDAGEGGSYHYNISTSDSTDLRIVVKLSRSMIHRELRVQCTQLAIGYGAMLVMGWMIAYYMSAYMTIPIINLKEKMKLVGRGRFETRMPVDSNDEIGQLESMFNNMTESLETLVHQVYEVSLASRDAQISALQSQINPHFLYNTLELINMMAISAGNYNVSEAVGNLGQMMRYCVSNENHYATLEEEITFVRAYSEIQKLRDEHLRSLEIICPQELLEAKVPKMLLQPFVENVIQHGLGDHAVDIVISIYEENRDLHITISNNGIPLDSDARQKLYQSLQEAEKPVITKSKSGKGYGLGNVHRRLRLLYGDNYGITLDETFHEGARFRIVLKREVTKDVSCNDCGR